MKIFNYLFSSEKRFESFLEKQNIKNSDKFFIQVFTGNTSIENLQNTLDSIIKLLPNSSIIATSTAGEIADGGMLENTTVISMTKFDATDVKVKLVRANDSDELANKVVEMTTNKTKLVIAFNNVYVNDGEDFLNALEEKIPNVMIAGGNAGDNGVFINQTLVGVNDKVSVTGLAIAVLDSDILEVHNDHLFNWQTIGEPMVVTKAEKSVVFEINNQKAQDIYKYFLGDEVAKELPGSGVEFPLIFNEDGLDIARAPVAIGENGELIMAGHIEQGMVVKFGFGDVTENDRSLVKTINQFSKNSIEGIYIYSCSARKYFLKNNLNSEFEMLNKIAPTSGFITYGEFYKQHSSNKVLNVSSTFVGLSENRGIVHELNLDSKSTTVTSRTLNALTNLVKQTSHNLEKKNIALNQFKDLIKASTLYSTTDSKGVITDVNDRFIELSGYSKEELIGKSHNIVRHEDMPSSTFKDMWKSIESKNSWKGIVKNRKKDGSAYYVRSNIFPILDIEGHLREYVSIRDDITEEIEQKLQLEGTLDELEEETANSSHLLGQYKKVINLNSAFFRVGEDFQFKYVNDVFCDIYHCSIENMLNKNMLDILESDFYQNHFKKVYKILIEKEEWTGIVAFKRTDNSIIHMNTSVSTIFDTNNKLVEYMVVMHDITDLIVAQKEIEETQRDVVYTMGAIGETRSRETGNHVKRVAEYSKILAVNYGLDESEAEMLRIASPMHDIGKVGIPDAILNKPGKLTSEEWEIMKTHSELGYEMLQNSKRDILKAAAVVAYTHHEKWDGSGYPNALSAEEIHIYGRITAIADVFDALGSDRCYKKAWSDEDIFQLLKDEKGKHFDPKLVDIFFNSLDQFLEIRSSLKD